MFVLFFSALIWNIHRRFFLQRILFCLPKIISKTTKQKHGKTNCSCGQCGNQIGNASWNTTRAEHKLAKDCKFTGNKDNVDDQRRLDKIDVYFKQAGELRFVPRAALVDLELVSLDAIKASPIGTMFKPDNFVNGASGAGTDWAKGHHTEGTELIDEVVDVFRKEAESYDCPQRFQITHSLGGGTGSGFRYIIINKNS